MINYHACYLKLSAALSEQPNPAQPTTSQGKPLSNKDSSVKISNNKDSLAESPANTTPVLLQEQMTKPKILESAVKLVSDLRSVNSKRFEYEAKSILYYQMRQNHVFPKWSVNLYAPELLMNTQEKIQEYAEFCKHQARELLAYSGNNYKKLAENKRDDAQWLIKRIIEKYSSNTCDTYNLQALWAWIDYNANRDKKHHERKNQLEYNALVRYPLEHIWHGVDGSKYAIPPEANPGKLVHPDTAAFQDAQDFRSTPQVRRGGRSKSRNRNAKRKNIQPSNVIQPLMSVDTRPPYQPAPKPKKQNNQRSRQTQPRAQNQRFQHSNRNQAPSATVSQAPSTLTLMEQNLHVSNNILSAMEKINQNLINLNQQ